MKTTKKPEVVSHEEMHSKASKTIEKSLQELHKNTVSGVVIAIKNNEAAAHLQQKHGVETVTSKIPSIKIIKREEILPPIITKRIENKAEVPARVKINKVQIPEIKTTPVIRNIHVKNEQSKSEMIMHENTHITSPMAVQAEFTLPATSEVLIENKAAIPETKTIHEEPVENSTVLPPNETVNGIVVLSTVELRTDIADDAEPDVTFDVLSDEDIDDLLTEILHEPTDEFTPLLNENSADTTEVESLPKTAVDFIGFTSLLKIPEQPNLQDGETITILSEMEIEPLPFVCIEVVIAIQELQNSDPEAAKAAVVTMREISLAVDEVMKLRLSGSELAIEAEEKLEILCIELFTRLGWALEPEKMMELMQGVMQTKQTAQVFTDKKAALSDRGTHEIKHEHDPIFGGMIQEIEDYLMRAIGTHAVRSYDFAPAN